MSLFSREKLCRLCVLVLVLLLATIASCSKRGRGAVSEPYRYDEQGRLIAWVGPGGHETGYRYNRQSLLTELLYQGGSVRFSYGRDGRLAWMADTSGRTEYYYDALDRLTVVIAKHSPWRLIRYEYDPWGYLARTVVYNLESLREDAQHAAMVRALEKIPEGLEAWEKRVREVEEWLGGLAAEVGPGGASWVEHDVRYRRNLLGNLKTGAVRVRRVG